MFSDPVSHIETICVYHSDFSARFSAVDLFAPCQVDLQAADRCHRIGQSRPVSVYRLVAPRTVEAAVVARAHTKRLIATLAIDRAGLNGSVLTAAAEEQQSASAAASSPSSDAKSADDSMVVPCESFGLNELSDLLYGGVSASPTSPSPSPGAVRSSKRAKSASNSGAASAKGGDAAAASSPSAASLLSSSYADHRASNAANAPDSTSLSATAAAVLAPVCISDDHLARLVRDFRFDVGAATATNGSMPAAASLDVGFEVSQFWFGQD